jgi:N-carbamoyl-L-amino-acid hydrolase
VRNENGSHNPDEHMEIGDFLDAYVVLAAWIAAQAG